MKQPLCNAETLRIQSALSKLCSQRFDGGLLPSDMADLRHSLNELNVSLMGQLPRSVIDAVLSHWHRRRCPSDVHRIMAAYAMSFECDAALQRVRERQTLLLSVASLDAPLVRDADFVFDAEWMICRVRQIRRGPLGQVTQLLLSYRIGLDLYGSLWSVVQYVAWSEQRQSWRLNVILGAAQQREWSEPLKVALFESWWAQWLPRWLKDERGIRDFAERKGERRGDGHVQEADGVGKEFVSNCRHKAQIQDAAQAQSTAGLIEFILKVIVRNHAVWSSTSVVRCALQTSPKSNRSDRPTLAGAAECRA